MQVDISFDLPPGSLAACRPPAVMPLAQEDTVARLVLQVGTVDDPDFMVQMQRTSMDFIAVAICGTVLAP